MSYENTSVENQAAVHWHELFHILAERQRQDNKFGANRDLTPQQLYLILGEEVGEVAQELLDIEFGNPDDPSYSEILDRYYEEMTQVAAVALCALQTLRRQRGVGGRFEEK